MKNTNKGTKITAMRSESKPSYRLIYKGFLEDLGAALEEGHEKYSEGEFDRNWQHGDEKFFRECLDHLIDHVMTYNETGDRYHNNEDHLAHAVANLMFIMWAEDFGKIRWPILEQQENEALNGTSSEAYARFDEHEEELEREEIIKEDQSLRDRIEAKEYLSEGLRASGSWFSKFLRKG